MKDKDFTKKSREVITKEEHDVSHRINVKPDDCFPKFAESFKHGQCTMHLDLAYDADKE